MGLFAWLEKRKTAILALRELSIQVGKAFESMSYEDLSKRSEENFSYPDQQVGDLLVSFSGEARNMENGDIEYTLDLHCKSNYLIFALPSYRFFKRRDGSVYY